MIDVKEILDKHGAYWVSKFDGKKSIDCENAKEAIKEIIESVLLEASNKAEIELRIYNSKGEYKYENLGQEITSEREREYYGASKESITSTINKVKF